MALETKQTEIVVITHTDLDGVTSGYLAGKAFNTDRIMSANYHEVQEKMRMVHALHGDVHLVVTDLNIVPDDCMYALLNFKTLTIFDHHPSSEDFLPLEKINPKFKIFFNDKVCATTLVAQFMMSNGHEFQDHEMKFFRYVNIYDTWKHDHPEFVLGRMANDLYWKYGWTYFLDKLRRKGIPDIPDGLEPDELKHIKQVFLDIEKAGRSAEWYNTDCGSTIVIIEQDQKIAINHFSDMIPTQTGIFYIIYFGGQYRCSIRVDNNNDGNYKIGQELEKFIKTSDVINNCGGHDSAAGCAFERGIKLPEALTEIEKFDSYLFEGMSNV